MVSADPIPKEPEGIDLNDPAVKHLSRPDQPAEPVERDYYGADGKPTPEHQSVSPEQAARDLANVRNSEREALETERNRELDEALRAHEAGQQQPAQDQQPQPRGFEPQQMTAEEAQRLYDGADRELETALQNPLLREK